MDCFHHSDCHERAMILMDVGLNRPVFDLADWATGRLRGDRMKPFIHPGGTDCQSFADSGRKSVRTLNEIAARRTVASWADVGDGGSFDRRDRFETHQQESRINKKVTGSVASTSDAGD